MRMERGIMGGDPTMTLYGHTARVWDARLMTDVIVSIGEVMSLLKFILK